MLEQTLLSLFELLNATQVLSGFGLQRQLTGEIDWGERFKAMTNFYPFFLWASVRVNEWTSKWKTMTCCGSYLLEVQDIGCSCPRNHFRSWFRNQQEELPSLLSSFSLFTSLGSENDLLSLNKSNITYNHLC